MELKIHLFANYGVYVTDEVEKWNNKVGEKYQISEDNKGFKGLTVATDNVNDFPINIFLKKDVKDSTIVHESVHAVELLMRRLNIIDDEFKAVAISYLANKIIEERNKQ